MTKTKWLQNPIITNSTEEPCLAWRLKSYYMECPLELYNSKRVAQKTCIKKNKVFGKDFFKVQQVLVIGDEVRDIKFIAGLHRFLDVEIRTQMLLNELKIND